jgi:hypothetical protein
VFAVLVAAAITLPAYPGDAPPNDLCENATPIGEVVDLPFDTTAASFDGPGECQDSRNVWYCYTPSCGGIVTIDTCGSGYDTKIAVYDACDPLGTIVDCNDDAFFGPCSGSLDSIIAFFAVAGQSYKIEVGGFAEDFGTGDLTITCPPLGACCLAAGVCQPLTESDCSNQDGLYRGDGVACDSICDQPAGACCFPDGSCLVLIEANCAAAGGAFASVGTPCDQAECQSPVGACCIDDKKTFCEETTPALCALKFGGTYMGDGTICDGVDCFADSGACCFPDGSCIVLEQNDCVGAGGVYQGDFTDCFFTVCGDAQGACCLPGGACAETDVLTCNNAGGLYQGDGVPCVAAPCGGPPLVGACCLPDGSCITTGFGGCFVQGGDYQGDGTSCLAADCPDPDTGACCLPPTGNCAVATPADCVAGGGLYQGNNVPCASVSCPQPALGACCFLGGSCSALTELACVVAGGVPQGDGTTCAAAACPGIIDDDRATTTEKGSLFIFSGAELRWSGGGPPGLPGPLPQLDQDIFLSLTNDGPADVRVLMYFVNGDPPLDPVFDAAGNLVERGHPGWNWLDNEITLTQNQPVYWSLNTGAPLGLSPFTALDPGMPPGRPAPDASGERVLRGFIIGWAVNADGEEIRWNHLAGNATAVHYALGYAWEVESTNHAVVSGVAEGERADATSGEISLDGAEYEVLPDVLLVNFQAAGSAAFGTPPAPRLVVSNTVLTLHPISTDLRQTTTGPATTKADFSVWNQNEVKFSGMHRCITCWDQTVFTRFDLPNHLLVFNLQTAHGKARIDGVAAPVQCDDPVAGVYSRKAAMLGIATRILAFDPGAAQDVGAAAAVLAGMGRESAQIFYDVMSGSQEAEGAAAPDAPALPVGATRAEIADLIDRMIRDTKR